MMWEPALNKYIKNPEFQQKDINKYILHDFDVLTAYFSILNWKKYNGKIKLYTNDYGLSLFEELGLAQLYDEVDTKLVDKQVKKYNVDPNIFWAGHKLMVLNVLKPPFVVFDYDLYAEINLEEIGFYEKDLGLFHFEAPSLTYPYPLTLKGYNDVNWPEDWDWDSHPVNVGILYFGNKKALKEYTTIALNYMDGNTSPSKYEIHNTRMTFAEQRVLGEFIAKTDYTTSCLITGLYYPLHYSDNVIGFADVKTLKTGIFKEDDHGLHKHSNIKKAEQVLNHLWGYKAVMLDNESKRASFVIRLREKFERDFPEHLDHLDTGLQKWYDTGTNSLGGQSTE